MLAELFELMESLKRCGVTTEKRHPDIHSPAKQGGYRIGLNVDGQPVDIRELASEETVALWTLGDNQKRFPVLRIQKALWQETDTTIRETLRKAKKEDHLPILRQAQREFTLRPVADLSKRRKQAQELADKYAASSLVNELECAALPAMLNRYLKMPEDSTLFVQALVELLLTRLEQGRLTNQSLAEMLLLGKIDPKEPANPPSAGVLLAFDVVEDAFPIHVADARMIPFVSRLLYDSQGDQGNNVKDASYSNAEVTSPTVQTGICAFTGKDTVLQTGPFPKPALPLLGPAILYSKFKDMPHLKRYGRIGDGTISVGREIVHSVCQALDTVQAKEWEGVLWSKVANGKFTTRHSGGKSVTTPEHDLLIIYVAEQAKQKDRLAALLADATSNDIMARQKFAAAAKPVCEALRAHATQHPQSRVNLFLLRKIDEGNSQVTLSDSFLTTDLIDAAQRWSQGVDGLPYISLPVPIAEGQPARWMAPDVPPPERVVRILQKVWFSAGTDTKKENKDRPFRTVAMQGVGMRQVLDLMLKKPGVWQQTAHTMLEMVITRNASLWKGLWGNLRRSTGENKEDKTAGIWQDYSAGARISALDAVGLVSLLLHLMDSRKENNMQESAFLVGRILAMADVLHKDYCVVERDREIPPTLIGNSAFGPALDDPCTALADLGERMRIYLAWANTAKWPQGENKNVEGKRECVRNAQNVLKAYYAVTPRLHNLGIPTHSQMTAELKAHLLLGYLADPMWSEYPTLNETQPDNIEQNGGTSNE